MFSDQCYQIVVPWRIYMAGYIVGFTETTTHCQILKLPIFVFGPIENDNYNQTKTSVIMITTLILISIMIMNPPKDLYCQIAAIRLRYRSRI